jgi:hypothetical protein
MVEEKNSVGEIDFIAYLDDDGSVKNQKIIIIKKDISGVVFRFPNNEQDTIFIPSNRILKIKGKSGGIL